MTLLQGFLGSWNRIQVPLKTKNIRLTTNMKLKYVILTAVVAIIAMSDAMAGTNKGAHPNVHYPYYGRNSWNARAPKCGLSYMSTINRAIFHHTASSGHYSTTSASTTFSNVRGTQNYHMDVNGWCDLGYHYLVDKLGNICVGRDNSNTDYPQGAHDGVNSSSFGFTFMGYFHTPYNNASTTNQRGAMWRLVAWRMPTGWSSLGSGSYGGTTVGRVGSHRNVLSTACPGDILFNGYIGNDWNGGTARSVINNYRP
jgi:hypothetical protein